MHKLLHLAPALLGSALVFSACQSPEPGLLDEAQGAADGDDDPGQTADLPGADVVDDGRDDDGLGDDDELGGDDALPVRPDLRCTYAPGTPFSPDSYWEAGPYKAASLEIEFVDPTRPVFDENGEAATDERVLKTRIHYPAKGGLHLFGDRPVAEGGPFPLLMYSHGYSSSKDEADAAGAHLASHGYIVVAPDFPGSTMMANMFSPVAADVINQPGDVSFLIDQMLAKNALASDHFFRAIDPARIGALGLSLGGLTTYLVTFHRDLLDPRIQAAAPIAGPAGFFTRRFFDSHPVPLLIVHGDLDAFIDYELNARVAFANATPLAHLVTVIDGSHAGFMNNPMMGLLGPLMAPDDADPSNPDGMGCGAVGAELQSVDPAPMMDGLGGPEIGVVVPEDLASAEGMLPCAGDEYTRPALDPEVQVAIAKTALLAFFDTVFAPESQDRQAACRFLNESLPEHPSVVFE